MRRRRNAAHSEVDWTPIILAAGVGVGLYMLYNGVDTALSEFEAWVKGLFSPLTSGGCTSPAAVAQLETGCQNIYTDQSPSTSGSSGLCGCALC